MGRKSRRPWFQANVVITRVVDEPREHIKSSGNRFAVDAVSNVLSGVVMAGAAGLSQS
jgi:hypothetical protein